MVITAALSIEMAPLLNALKAENIRAYSNKTGFYRGGGVDLLITGIGPAQAQRTLEAYLKENEPGHILNIGTCGMLFENMKLGEIHHIASTVTENEDPIHLHMLIDKPGKICLSVRRSIKEPGLRDSSQKKYKAHLADMECYTLAAVARRHNIPMSAIKITTDFADCETTEMFKKQVEGSAKKLADTIINIIKP